MSPGRGLPAPLSGLLLVLFVATLSSTVVSTALPEMLGRLRGSPSQLTWVVTAALLTATASTPIWGKLADLHNKKMLLQIAIAVFVAGSLAAGLSQSAGFLIAARAVQGAGVGGLQALAQITIAVMIPPRERGRYSGYLSSATALSTIGGPLLGGLIVDTSWLGWRWCFFVGIPVAVAALVVLQLRLHLPVAAPRDGPETARGVLALTLEAVLPVRILRQRTTALAILGSLAAGTAMYGAAVFLAQYFQLARGFSATQAGLLTIPMMAGILLTSIVGGRMLSRSGRIKPFLVTGAILLTVGLGLLGLTGARTPLVLMGAGMLAVGAGIGLTMQNFVLVVQNSVPLRDVGTASSTVSFFRSLGGTAGVAVLGAVFAGRADAHATSAVAYGNATGTVFLISAVVAVLGIVSAVLLPPVRLRSSLDLPAEPDGHREVKTARS